MDATVWFGALDMKFQNTSDGYLLLRDRAGLTQVMIQWRVSTLAGIYDVMNAHALMGLPSFSRTASISSHSSRLRLFEGVC